MCRILCMLLKLECQFDTNSHKQDVGWLDLFFKWEAWKQLFQWDCRMEQVLFSYHLLSMISKYIYCIIMHLQKSDYYRWALGSALQVTTQINHISWNWNFFLMFWVCVINLESNLINRIILLSICRVLNW